MTDDVRMTLDTLEIEYEDELIFLRKEDEGILITVYQGGSESNIVLYEEDAETLAEWLLKTLNLKVVKK